MPPTQVGTETRTPEENQKPCKQGPTENKSESEPAPHDRLTKHTIPIPAASTTRWHTPLKLHRRTLQDRLTGPSHRQFRKEANKASNRDQRRGHVPQNMVAASPPISPMSPMSPMSISFMSIVSRCVDNGGCEKRTRVATGQAGRVEGCAGLDYTQVGRLGRHALQAPAERFVQGAVASAARPPSPSMDQESSPPVHCTARPGPEIMLSPRRGGA